MSKIYSNDGLNSTNCNTDKTFSGTIKENISSHHIKRANKFGLVEVKMLFPIPIDCNNSTVYTVLISEM